MRQWSNGSLFGAQFGEEFGEVSHVEKSLVTALLNSTASGNLVVDRTEIAVDALRQLCSGRPDAPAVFALAPPVERLFRADCLLKYDIAVCTEQSAADAAAFSPYVLGLIDHNPLRTSSEPKSCHWATSSEAAAGSADGESGARPARPPVPACRLSRAHGTTRGTSHALASHLSIERN